MTQSTTPFTPLKHELYKIVDSFLVEAKNQDGMDRSLERLNQDRHLAVEALEKLIAESISGERSRWIKYSDKKPEIGQLVACYRDIESKQIFIIEWNKEEERYAEMNKITHWKPMSYPVLSDLLTKESNDK